VNGVNDEHKADSWDIHAFNRQRGRIVGADGKIMGRPSEVERPYVFDWGNQVADLTGLPVSTAQALR
jgi:hypothetical protein